MDNKLPQIIKLLCFLWSQAETEIADICCSSSSMMSSQLSLVFIITLLRFVLTVWKFRPVFTCVEEKTQFYWTRTELVGKESLTKYLHIFESDGRVGRANRWSDSSWNDLMVRDQCPLEFPKLKLETFGCILTFIDGPSNFAVMV